MRSTALVVATLVFSTLLFGCQPSDGWVVYKNMEIGIQVEHPSEMKIDEGTYASIPESAVLTYWGPTQKAQTELYDGIAFNIVRDTYEETLQDVIDRDISEAETMGNITESLSTTNVAGRNALTYQAQTLGLFTHYYIDLGNNEYLLISTTAPDPTGAGFDAMVERMLQSVELL